MRNRTHLPAFEPGCTVVGRAPSIDHFRLNIRDVSLPVETDAARVVLNYLPSEFFRGGSSRYSYNVREGTLLFGGRLSVNNRPDGHGSLVLQLKLNLTRFLAYRYEELLIPEALDELDGHRLSAVLRNPAHQGRSTRRRMALDDNDNVIPDRVLRSGLAPDHLMWVQPYISAVSRFVGEKVTDAIERAQALSAIPQVALNPLLGEQHPRVYIHSDNWSVSHVEVYWEFWSENAIAQAAEASPLLHSSAATSRLTVWRPATDEIDQAAIGVSANLGANGITGKLYAKFANRLRLEVEYRGNPKNSERISAETIQSFGPMGVTWFFALISDRAALRGERFLQNAWERAAAEDLQLGPRRVASFLEAIAREAGSPALFSLILSQLLTHGSARSTRGHTELRGALRRLVARRYLEGVQLGISGTFTAYRPTAPYEPIIVALRRLSGSDQP